MRRSLLLVAGLGLSGCATAGARTPLTRFASSQQNTAADTAASPLADAANSDALICERSFQDDSTCPVLGTLNPAEQQSLASFMQEQRTSIGDDLETQPTPTLMQASDDPE